jgi:hypothetical protein
VHTGFGGNSEGKSSLGRRSCRWEDSIKIDLKQVGWEGVDWVELAQNKDKWRAVFKMIMNLRVQ